MRVQSRSRSLETEVVVRDDLVAALAEEWDALALECGAGPFARPTYALAWWRTLGQGRLLVVTVRSEGRLVALAPLHERRIGPVAVARWLGHGLGTVAEILVRPDVPGAATALWAAVDSPRRVLQLLDCSGAGAGLTELAERPGLRTTVSLSDSCPYLDLDGRDPAAVLAAPRYRRLRRALSISERRMAAAGLTWRVEVADDAASWDRLRGPVLEVYDAAEAAQPRHHLLAGPTGAFTDDFVATAVASGEALVVVGFADDRPVCFDIVLLTPTAWSWWVGRFAPDAASFSPGHLLLRAGLSLAAECGVSRIDLLLGDAEYKRRWATDSYPTHDVLSGRRLPVALVNAVVRAVDLRRRRPWSTT